MYEYMNLQNLKNPPIPKSFILPEDAKWLQHDMHKNPNRTYIRKPIVGSQGNGISLISDPAQLDMSKKQIVQRYEKLVLVNGRKFDLRVYFLITSVDPLLVYVYPEGLARFATHEYEEPSAQNMGDKKMHLTNFAQNSEHKQLVSSNYQANKMEMTLLLDYLEKHKFLFQPQVQKTISKEYLFEQIQNTIKLALVGSYRSTLKHWVSGKHYGYYGADIGFKEDGSPILFEINLGPSLNVDTALDFNLKMKMMRQAYELVGLRTGSGDNSSSHEKEFKNWFDDSLPMEEKSALMQIVDEDLRKGDWIRLEFDDLAMGKFNKVVSRSKELIAKEIDKRKTK